jgi:hypothetical protein
MNNPWVVIGLFATYILLLVLGWSLLPAKPRKNFIIELANDGNVRSNYQLTITPVSDEIDYQLSRDGARLTPLAVELDAAQTQPEESADPVAAGNPASRSAPLQKREPKPAADSVRNAAASGKRATGLVGALATFFGILGSILPGKLGSGLKARSASLRNAQSSATRTMQAPAMAKSRASALRSAGSRISGKSSDQPKGQETALPESDRKEKRSASKDKSAPPKPTFFRTLLEDVAPGDALSLDLLVVQRKGRPPESGFALSFESLQQPHEETESSLAPVRRQAVVNYDPIPVWRRLVAPLFSLALTALFVVLLLPRI